MIQTLKARLSQLTMVAYVASIRQTICNEHRQKWLHGCEQAHQMLLREMHGVEQITLRIITKH
jgi:hypothetical protein